MTELTAALNHRRERERGFSLIELIIVIVILGILVAIAIPVYNNIQDNARTNAVKTAAANGASQGVSKIAQGGSVTSADLTNLNTSDITVTVVSGGTSTDKLCVQATNTSANKTAYAGPGAKSDGSGCTA